MNKQSTWRYLKRDKREALIWFTCEAFDKLVEKEQWGTLYDLYSTLADLAGEGMTLSDDWKAVLIHPFKLWGSCAIAQLESIRKRQNKRLESHWITKGQRDLMRDVSGEMVVELVKASEFDILQQALNVLHNMKDTHGWNDDQREFVELAEYALNNQRRE